MRWRSLVGKLGKRHLQAWPQSVSAKGEGWDRCENETIVAAGDKGHAHIHQSTRHKGVSLGILHLFTIMNSPGSSCCAMISVASAFGEVELNPMIDG